jgi:dTDP-4-dehydrorhamnose 3,5-epimerase-like enzyme
VFEDERGTLTLVASQQMPFPPRRTYVLHRMPAGARRGGHANRSQRRLLVGLSGAATVTIADGRNPDRHIVLGGGDTMLIQPGIWFELEIHDEDAAILVFADGDYDPGDRVRERSQLPLDATTAAQTSPA